MFSFKVMYFGISALIGFLLVKMLLGGNEK